MLPHPHLVLAVCLCMLLLSEQATHAQDKQITYDVSAAVAAGVEDQVPFWLTANRNGRIDRYSNSAVSQMAWYIPSTPGKRFDYSAGVELLGRRSDRSTLTAHQLYGRLRYDPLQLTAGRIEHVTGLTDSSLSVGSMTWSRNAPPVPKVSLTTPEFLSIPGTEGWVGVKGYLAHGWMEPGRAVEGAYLHEKYFYLRLSPDGLPVRGYGGIEQNSIWGGVHPRRGEQRQSFSDYIQTFIGYRPDSDNHAEALGNTVAIYDFALEWDGRVDGRIYRQFYIEDKPALFFRSPWDGLWGVSLDVGSEPRFLIDRVLWEHVNTKRQGSKYVEGEDGGADNYYNHSVYWSGWTHRGRTIGTPLLFSDGRRIGVANNRLVAHHIGVSGYLPADLRYRLLLTYSRNYGARVIFEEGTTRRMSGRTQRADQYSYLLEVTGPLLETYGLDFTAGLALDHGSVHPNNVGLLLGISYGGVVGDL